MKDRILVVDDLIENISVLFEILKEEYAVVTSTSAEEALEVAFSQPRPNLILLDVMMPKIDGYDLCKMLKADERTNDIPVIFITALNRPHDEKKGFDVGAVDFINKPVIPQILRSRIKIHLDLVKKSNKLQSQYKELNVLFEQQPVGLAYVHCENNTYSFKRINSEMCDLLGYKQQELLHISPDEILNNYQEWDQFMRKIEGSISLEDAVKSDVELKRSDGSIIYCRLQGRILNYDDNYFEFVLTVIDMTMEHNLEQLRSHVEQITRHDLKGPLNGIINIPQMLASENNLSEKQKRLINLIEKSGKNMLSQINGTLNLLKVEERQYKYTPKECDLHGIIQEILWLYGSILDMYEISVEIRHNNEEIDEKKIIKIKSDPGLLQSILSNLLINAIDASSDKSVIGIDINTSLEVLTIMIHNEQAIPEEIRDTFFNRFATHGKSNGTGLGTYTARRMVEAMSGEISYTTDEIDGTTLIVDLPQI